MIINCQTIVDALGDLPPTPVVAVKVVKLMEDPYVSAQLLADAISHDAAVSARILRAANSPMFYAGQKVATLQQALVTLGDDNVKNLVLEASMRAINKSFGLVERMLWEESVGCALGGRVIARYLNAEDPEEAFFAGLFHNVGKIVMNNHSKITYKQILAELAKGEVPLEELERAFFAFTHEEVGAAVLEKWNFAPSQIITVLHHKDLSLPDDTEPEICRLAAMINVASNLYNHLGAGPKIHAQDQDQDQDQDVDLTQLPGARILNITHAQIEDIAGEFKVTYEEGRAMFLL